MLESFFRKWDVFLPLPSPNSLHMSLVNLMSATIQHYRPEYPTESVRTELLGQREHVCNIGTIDSESAGIFGGLFHFLSVKRRRWVLPERRLKGTVHHYRLLNGSYHSE